MNAVVETSHELAERQIDDLQHAIMALPGALDPADGDNEWIQCEHFFGPGTYVRKLTRKAGVVIVGKRHRNACITILLSGRLAITSTTGDITGVVEAGTIWTSLPLTKRATFALEDSVLVTVHPNPENLTDVDAIEAAIILPEDLT